jgi:hypothetical protein
VKAAATSLAILAILIAVVPMFTDCHSAGHTMTLANGREIPMKCHWTGRAELGLGLPLLAVGLVTAVNRRKESYRSLGLLGGILGVVAILLPTTLIGTCGSPEMSCNTVMKPALILMGILAVGISLAVVVFGWRREQESA